MTIPSASFNVYANIGKNRLYVQINRLYRREVPVLVKKIETEARKLKDQFTCITDLRYYDRNLRNVDKSIQQVQNMLIKTGMQKVVRVHSAGPQSLEIEAQFEAISQQTAGYSAYTTTSMKVAEKILDDLFVAKDVSP